MDFCLSFKRRRTQQLRRRTPWHFSLPLLPPLPMMILLFTVVLVVAFSWTRLHPGFLYSYHSRIVSDLGDTWGLNDTTSIFQFQDHGKAAAGTGKSSSKSHSYFNFSQAETRSEFYTPVDHQTGASSSPSPQELHMKKDNGPYRDWDVFSADYQEMMRTLKIFVYPDALKENNSSSSPFDSIFLPLANLMDPKLGNYFSEHAFKVALLGSSLVTRSPEEAHFFFMPFSINVMRNYPLLHSASSISDFVAEYTRKISSEFWYWNASGGSDHFYVCCHSIGREAASKHPALHTNAIQVTCSSSYFQRLYITHKDIGLPQIWPRRPEPGTNPPDSRKFNFPLRGRI